MREAEDTKKEMLQDVFDVGKEVSYLLKLPVTEVLEDSVEVKVLFMLKKVLKGYFVHTMNKGNGLQIIELLMHQGVEDHSVRSEETERYKVLNKVFKSTK